MKWMPAIWMMGLLLSASSLTAQYSRTIDSLVSLLESSRPDTLQVNRLNEVARLYNMISPDTSLQYSMRSAQLAEKIGFKRGLGKAYVNAGISYDNLGQLEKSLQYYRLSRSVIEQTPYRRELSPVYTNSGIVYLQLGKIDSALWCYEQSLALKDTAKDQISIGIVYTNIGVVYNDLGDLDKALDYFLRSRAIAKRMGDTQGIADNDLNIADIYHRQGDLEKTLEILQEAEKAQNELGDKEGLCYTYEAMGNNLWKRNDFGQGGGYLTRALAIAREMQLLLRIGSIHHSFGDYYAAQKKFDRALAHYDSSVITNTQLGDIKSLILNRNALGNADLALDRHQAAIQQFSTAAGQSEQIGYLEGLRDAYHGLAVAYRLAGDFEKAYEFVNRKSVVNDSLRSESITRRLMRLQVQFETEKKDEQIALLNAQTQLQESENRKQLLLRNVFIAGFLTAIAFAALYYYNARRNRRLNDLLHEKNEIILQQKNQVEQALAELKQSQLQLIHTEKMASLGQLTAGVAHEINNPINFVSANINPLRQNITELIGSLQEKTTDPSHPDVKTLIEETHQLLKGIEEGSRRTAEIVKGLRNFSRADEDSVKEFDLTAGIESSLLLLKNKLDHQQIEVVKNFSPLPELTGYPGQINQVWMNLLSNAADAIGTGGRITLTTSGAGREVKVSVKDNGRGMNEAVRKKIFDPFFTTKDVGTGTGLGLSISYGIIQKHGGAIEVQSEEGRGTEFIVTLPVQPYPHPST
jgi:signal transduction histidine kinase